MSCYLFAYFGYNYLKELKLDPVIKKYKLSKDKNDYHYIVVFTFKKRLFTFDAARYNRGDVYLLYEYMDKFNPKYVTNLTDTQFKKLEKMFNNIDKIKMTMYLNECGFNKSIDEVVIHIKKELIDGLKFESKYLS